MAAILTVDQMCEDSSRLKDRKVPKKDHTKWCVAIAERMGDAKKRQSVLLAHLPSKIFDDIQGPMDPDLALDLLVRGVHADNRLLDEIRSTCEALIKVDALSPFRPAKREEARKAVREVAQAEKNEDLVARDLFTDRDPPNVTTAAGNREAPIQVEDLDTDGASSESASVVIEKKKAVPEGPKSFSNNTFLYECKRWREVRESGQCLRDALMKEFCPVNHAKSWEYAMNEKVIASIVRTVEESYSSTAMQLLVDGVLLRCKLSMDGVKGERIEEAMKRLEQNRLPEVYRNILKSNNAGSYSFRSQQQSDIQRGRPQQFNAQQRSRSATQGYRVPNELWKTLTEEQRNIAKKR